MLAVPGGSYVAYAAYSGIIKGDRGGSSRKLALNSAMGLVACPLSRETLGHIWNSENLTGIVRRQCEPVPLLGRE